MAGRPPADEARLVSQTLNTLRDVLSKARDSAYAKGDRSRGACREFELLLCRAQPVTHDERVIFHTVRSALAGGGSRHHYARAFSLWGNPSSALKIDGVAIDDTGAFAFGQTRSESDDVPGLSRGGKKKKRPSRVKEPRTKGLSQKDVDELIEAIDAEVEDGDAAPAPVLSSTSAALPPGVAAADAGVAAAGAGAPLPKPSDFPPLSIGGRPPPIVVKSAGAYIQAPAPAPAPALVSESSVSSSNPHPSVPAAASLPSVSLPLPSVSLPASAAAAPPPAAAPPSI